MPSSVDIVHFIPDVSDTSFAVELAGGLNDLGLSVEVCAFFPPEKQSFGVDVHSLDSSSQLSARPYWRLYRYLCDRSPKILHVHPNATGAMARIIGRMAGIPVIVSTEHSTHERFSAAKNAINGGTNWLSDAVVANSQSTADSLARWERSVLNLSGTELTVIHNGVDEALIRRSESDPPPWFPDGQVIGTVGRLVPVKNYPRLLRAAVPLVEENDISVVIVGDGPERAALESLAADLEIDDDVYFPGYQPRDEVYRLLHSFDVFGFPSLAEGFGVAVVEAMTAGVPPVVSDIQVMHEIVDDAGLYVQPANVNDIREALRTVLAEPETRTQLSERARQRAVTEFSLSKTVASYAELYERLISTEGQFDLTSR